MTSRQKPVEERAVGVMKEFIDSDRGRRVVGLTRDGRITWTMSAGENGSYPIEEGPAYGDKVYEISFKEEKGHVYQSLSGSYARFTDSE